MATLDDVADIVATFPEVTEGVRYHNRGWFVAGKQFAWERPFSKADLKRFGDEIPPAGPILAVAVDDLADKQAALDAQPEVFFTIPHFDGYAAVLIDLPRASKKVLREAILDAWLAKAPEPLARAHLAR